MPHPPPKQRVTFRVEPDLVAALRRLPNQTAFVERVLRDSLGRVCPLCEGTGATPDVHLSVSNFKNLPGRRLDRVSASHLKNLVRLGRELNATALELIAAPDSGQLGFRLTRQDEQLLSGALPSDSAPSLVSH